MVGQRIAAILGRGGEGDWLPGRWLSGELYLAGRGNTDPPWAELDQVYAEFLAVSLLICNWNLAPINPVLGNPSLTVKILPLTKTPVNTS